MKCRVAGKEKTLALGAWPDVSPRAARGSRDDARRVVASGEDPSALRQEQKRRDRIKAANSFEVVAREWVEARRSRWTPGHADRVLTSFLAGTFPDLGTLPVADLAASDVLDVLRKIEKRGSLEVASHRSEPYSTRS